MNVIVAQARTAANTAAAMVTVVVVMVVVVTRSTHPRARTSAIAVAVTSGGGGSTPSTVGGTTRASVAERRRRHGARDCTRGFWGVTHACDALIRHLHDARITQFSVNIAGHTIRCSAPQRALRPRYLQDAPRVAVQPHHHALRARFVNATRASAVGTQQLHKQHGRVLFA
jgi:hypothetical protein